MISLVVRKLVHLVVFILKKLVRMHGHTKVRSSSLGRAVNNLETKSKNTHTYNYPLLEKHKLTFESKITLL